jgi:hypothetical protein
MFSHYFFIVAYVLSLAYSTGSLIHLILKKLPMVINSIKEEQNMPDSFNKKLNVAGTTSIIVSAAIILCMAIYLWVYLLTDIL